MNLIGKTWVQVVAPSSRKYRDNARPSRKYRDNARRRGRCCADYLPARCLPALSSGTWCSRHGTPGRCHRFDLPADGSHHRRGQHHLQFPYVARPHQGHERLKGTAVQPRIHPGLDRRADDPDGRLLSRGLLVGSPAGDAGRRGPRRPRTGAAPGTRRPCPASHRGAHQARTHPALTSGSLASSSTSAQ